MRLSWSRGCFKPITAQAKSGSPVLESPAWKVTMEELDHFYLDVRTQGSTGMPCQHLTVHSVLSAMLKTTFTMSDWLTVPTWLTVEELSWCHSYMASKVGKYVFWILKLEIRCYFHFNLIGIGHWSLPQNVDQISCIHFVVFQRAFDSVDISHVYCEPVWMTCTLWETNWLYLLIY